MTDTNNPNDKIQNVAKMDSKMETEEKEEKFKMWVKT